MKDENQIADAIRYAARELGNGGAATSMGALEAFGLVVKEGLEAVANAVSDLADAIREHKDQS